MLFRSHDNLSKKNTQGISNGTLHTNLESVPKFKIY